MLRGHEDDPGPTALVLRLMGAVNRLALDGSEPRLAALYADLGRDEGAAWHELSEVFARNLTKLRELVDLPVQTNEVGRCAALLPAFLTVAAETGLPLRLLEVGASAGLNLRWDRYRYWSDGFTWGPDDSPVAIEFELRGGASMPDLPNVEIAARRGCDRAPIDLGTSEGRISALAYIWPDQMERVERTEAALRIAAGLPITVDAEGVGTWVERQLADPASGQATIVYHSLVAQYFSNDQRSAFHASLKAAAARATADAPLAWLRMEPAGEWTEVRLSTWPGGERRLIARAGYHGDPVELLTRPDPVEEG